MESRDHKILIGTSGYDYQEWKGIFYPQSVKREDFLPYYSGIFNTVELNYTFYQLTTKEQIQKIIEKTEKRLQFAVKVNRALTHEIKKDWKNTADKFKESINPLVENGKLCSLLFQLPPYFSYTAENRIYLARLLAQFKEYPKVVEFRNREWLKDSVYKGLEERQTSIAWVKLPTDINTRFIGPIAYIRIHDHVAYSEEQLEKFLKLAEKAKSEGKEVIVYFGKYADECGVGGAVKLKGMIEA